MGTELVARLGNALTQGRAHDEELAAVARARAVSEARVSAGSYVAYTALQHAGTLSAIEGHLIERVPLGERRYAAIVDSFTHVACSALSDLSIR